MGYPTVSYQFVNSQTADAGQVNTNFNDLVTALSDSTKDLNVANVAASNVTISDTFYAASALVAGTLTVSGLFAGARAILAWNGPYEGNSTGYINGDGTVANRASPFFRTVVPRSGSVIAITTAQYVSACANAQTCTPSVVNSSSGVVVAASTLTVSAGVTGFKTGTASTFARGTYPFSAGDYLAAHVVMSGTAGSAAMAGQITVAVEVVFDT